MNDIVISFKTYINKCIKVKTTIYQNIDYVYIIY